MKTIKNKVVLAMLGGLCLGLMNQVHAASKKDEETRFPIGCVPVGYKQELKVLTLLPGEAGERNSMYLVYNKLSRPVTLYNMKERSNYYGVYWNHKIQPNTWSVFSTNEKRVRFICTVDDRKLDYGRIVDCADTLKVCEYPKVKFGLNNRGNLWIVGSSSRNGAVRGIVHYGIIPAY